MKKIMFVLAALLVILFIAMPGKTDHGTFKLGMDPSFLPLDTMGQEVNISGYCQEIFQKVGNESHQSIELLKAPWDDLLPQLKNDKLDGIITTLNPYNFYKKDFVFSKPLLSTGPCLVSTKAKPYSQLKNLNGKILGVILGSDSEIFVLQPDVIIQSFETPASLLDALIRGQIDAALLDYLIAFSYCTDLYAEKLIITSKPLGESGIRFITKKTNHKALLLIKAVDDFVEDRNINSLLKKWHLPYNL